jgi:hypothetical protein
MCLTSTPLPTSYSHFGFLLQLLGVASTPPTLDFFGRVLFLSQTEADARFPNHQISSSFVLIFQTSQIKIAISPNKHEATVWYDGKWMRFKRWGYVLLAKAMDPTSPYLHLFNFSPCYNIKRLQKNYHLTVLSPGAPRSDLLSRLGLTHLPSTDDIWRALVQPSHLPSSLAFLVANYVISKPALKGNLIIRHTLDDLNVNVEIPIKRRKI